MLSLRPAFVLVSLLLALTCGCHHAGRGPDLPPSVRRDPVLGRLPLGTDLLLHVDLQRLSASPTYALLREDLLTLASAMNLTACGEEPFEQLASFTLARDADSDPMLVLHGRTRVPSAACGEAWARALLGSVPARSVHVGLLRIYASVDDVDALRAALTGNAPTLADDLRFSLLRPALHDSAVVAVADLDALPLTSGDLPPVLGLPREQTLRMIEAATVQAIELRVEETGGLRIAALTTFAEPESVRSAWAFASEIWARNLPFARAAVLSVPSALDLTDADGEHLLVLAEVVDGVVISDDEGMVRVEAQLDERSLTSAAELVRGAFERYARIARSTEARSNVLRLAIAMQTLAANRFRETGGSFDLPSAPTTPAEIPRGLEVVDPPGTWDGALWRALGFSIEEPHRYSYAITTGADGFRVTARGDLDGDGTASEFGMVGTFRPDGTVELGDLEIASELE